MNRYHIYDLNHNEIQKYKNLFLNLNNAIQESDNNKYVKSSILFNSFFLKNRRYKYKILWNPTKERIEAMLVYIKKSKYWVLEFLISRPGTRKTGKRLILNFLADAQNNNIPKIKLQNLTRGNVTNKNGKPAFILQSIWN